jgi:predicted Zn-dependent peptidase
LKLLTLSNHTHQLSNGLQIFGQSMPDFESVALSYYVRTGARDEEGAHAAGISHFLEHMIFKGTKTLGWQALKQEFTRMGAQKNGLTSSEYTVYYLRVLNEYLDRALKLLSDMMVPRLDEHDFETEKEVIVNEIARSEDQPHGLAYRRMMHAYFGDHPLGNYVLGSRESIRSMRIEHMRDYWERQYGANNLILSVAGTFAWNQVVALAEHYCSSWRNGDAGRRQATPYEPEKSTTHVLVDTKLKQQILLITMPAVDARDSDYEAAVLGASILGHHDGSRLYWNIRQKGLAESVGSSVWALEGTGILFMEARTTPQEAPRVLKLLRAELGHLLEEGVGEDELRRAKDKRIASKVLGSESTYARMRALASDWVTHGRLMSIDEEIERIEQVTTEDIMRTLHRFPMRQKQVLTTLGPLNPRDAQRDSIAEQKERKLVQN